MTTTITLKIDETTEQLGVATSTFWVCGQLQLENDKGRKASASISFKMYPKEMNRLTEKISILRELLEEK